MTIYSEITENGQKNLFINRSMFDEKTNKQEKEKKYIISELEANKKEGENIDKKFYEDLLKNVKNL